MRPVSCLTISRSSGSPEEDRYRGSNPQRRRYRDHGGPGQVSAGFHSNNEQRDNGGQREEYPKGSRQHDNYHRSDGHRDDYQRNSGYPSRNRDSPGTSKPEYRSRFPREYVSPEDALNGPCQMHFFTDSQGKRQSSHLMKDCRTFQNLQRAMNSSQTQAVQRGFVGGPRSEIHVPLPPPPAITNGSQATQLQIEAANNQSGGYT